MAFSSPIFAPSFRRSVTCLGVVLAALGVVGCASGPKKLAVCNGHHLRDVNIYGSVLPGSPVPATTAPRAAPPIPPLSHPRDGDPPPPPAVPSASSSGDKVSFAPRGPHYASC
ncbi:hypothetical protein FIM10_16980 [Sphingomonadales bacterium 56]|uniref:Uncharacterized protein n=1 Tax=Sphingobium indicum TaxID=332055 RepID=A0A4Q4IX85_9SPHN|nr:hypothetical protein K426_27500 [Sphingobium sp. TKS]MBY2930375.1 hypothetical protein [Sphingomonadales bacterium 56]MBY2960461.1 hypothetical protein [Sphingomonadales bacterium 58]RYL97950.1 hypothetical protein EWH08_18225 [Sphingobium indicum]